MFEYKIINYQLTILSTINDHNIGYNNSDKTLKYTTKQNAEFSKFTNDSMSYSIYERVLDRDSTYRVVVIIFNRLIYYYLGNEGNIDSDI